MVVKKRVILNRIAAALLGGYVFSWGFAALGIIVLVAIGTSFHEAEEAIMIITLLILPVSFLWAFAADSMLRVWTVLAGGGAVMTVLALSIQHSILSGA